MANNNNNRFNQNQYTPEELIEGLTKTAVPLNQSGIIIRERVSALQTKIEDLIANTWGIAEIDHVYLSVVTDRNGVLRDILTRAYFNTYDVTNGDIVRTGRGKTNNKGVFNAVEYMGGAAVATGDFQLSDKFKKSFAAVALTDDDKLDVRSLENNPGIGILDLDTRAIMSVVLLIDEASPYNFEIPSAQNVGSNNDPEYILKIEKYIDLSSRKRGRHKGRRVNYAEHDKAFAKQNARYTDNGRRF